MKHLFTILLILVFLVSCKKDPTTQPAPVIAPAPFVLSVSVYPNPTTGIFTIKTNDTKPDSVLMYDVLGNIKLKQTINGTTVFDLIGLQNGVYYVKIIGRGTTIIRKILVSH